MLVSLLLPLSAGLGVVPGWPVLGWSVLVSGLILTARRIMRTPPASNIGRAVGLLLAGITWVDALAVSTVSPLLSICFGLSLPLLLLWQRKIAAT